MNIHLLKPGFMAAFLMIIGGCNTVANAEPVPAVFAGSDIAAHAELEAVVSKALNGIKVTLAPDILTDTNKLIVERMQHRTIQNNPLDGRSMERPNHFTLTSANGACFLTHDETGEIYELQTTACIPQA